MTTSAGRLCAPRKNAQTWPWFSPAMAIRSGFTSGGCAAADVVAMAEAKSASGNRRFMAMSASYRGYAGWYTQSGRPQRSADRKSDAWLTSRWDCHRSSDLHNVSAIAPATSPRTLAKGEFGIPKLGHPRPPLREIASQHIRNQRPDARPVSRVFLRKAPHQKPLLLPQLDPEAHEEQRQPRERNQQAGANGRPQPQ